MSSSQVYVTVAGHLGQDAKMQYMPNGTPVLKFSVAGRVGYGEREETQWISCSLFGKRAETLQQYLTKGTLVSVRGSLSRAVTNNDQGNPWFNVSVGDVDLLGSGQARSEPNVGEAQEAEEEEEYDPVPF